MPAYPQPLHRLVEARQLARGQEGRRIREAAQIGLRDLAAAIGTNAGELSRWERGLARPRAVSALRWLEAIEIVRTQLADPPTPSAQIDLESSNPP